MEPSLFSHTIAAIATPPGKGGIGVIRLSGANALTIGEKICNKSLVIRHAVYSNFYSSVDGIDEVLDQGLALYFKGPHSFTGEDVVELQGHGGPVVLDAIMQACLAAGAIHAKPGEFSERAFLNNKIDLTQAEAIADLIDSSSLQAAKNAIHSLQGDFSKTINLLLEKVINIRIFVEAAIDFPEEEIDFISDSNVRVQISEIQNDLKTIIQDAQQGRIIQEGVNLVIAGKPNAGKSSLLNALAGDDLAIVTHIAGTTRDTIKEQIIIDGLPVYITDTAGLRESDDLVEQEGIKRAEKAISRADGIILVIDSSSDNDKNYLPKQISNDTPVTRIFNKIDLSGHSSKIIKEKNSTDIYLSAQTGIGLDLLKKHVVESAGIQNHESKYSARRRHIDSLIKASQAVNTGLQQLVAFGAPELLAEDLRDCQKHLGTITGQFTADDLLGEIFSSFCIGK